MPNNNFKKTAIRQRMEDTGESYSVAARHLSKLDWWGELSEVIGSKYAFDKPGLYIIASRPGIGKTTAALRILTKTAQRGKRAFFASAELGIYEVAQRITAIGANVPLVAVKEYDSAYADKIASANKSLSAITISGVNNQPIRAVCNQVIDENVTPSIVVVDYLQLFTDYDTGMRSTKTNNALLQLRALQSELGIVVVLLCQLRKEVGSAPGLNDMQDIEENNNGDVVMVLGRDDASGDITCNVIKNNFGDVGKLSSNIPAQK